MANIRNQDSWVHQNDPEAATLKAKDLVRMGVAKVALADPLSEITVNIIQRALVIGGGLAGTALTYALARAGAATLSTILDLYWRLVRRWIG